MDYDIYFRLKQEVKEQISEYVDYTKALAANPMENFYLKDKIDEYNNWNYGYACSEEELVGLIFSLHRNDHMKIERETDYEIIIYPHVNDDTTVINLKTHEVRVVKHVNRDTVTLYNHDNSRRNPQKDGHVKTIKETWNRKYIIPFDPAKVGPYFGFYIGSKLGQCEGFDELLDDYME